MTDRRLHCPSAKDGWRKSSYSNTEGGSCLEVLDGHPVGVPVRDSKYADGHTLLFSAPSWASFVAALGGGRVG
ncbi:hypothetical protein QFZ63_005034 [Streptomyces sp. B3I7]|uniref:DUF397 domain-containing protein n=1 Tax=Streptomyces sp. B3I7 TaxID=3042269 RepID=UPI00277FDF1C|nr:DUF397 domain-containing protein [Streptomyces sp. B3I7]MDQ0813320.1 hypothetical protein [Streptomyces sp. B3I7]